jgi:transposase
VFAVKSFYKNDNLEAVRSEFRWHFNLHRHDLIPSAYAIKIWVSNFKETGSALKKKPSGGRQTVRTPENTATLRTAVNRTPRRSAVWHAIAMNISDRSVRRMLHNELRIIPTRFR